MDGAAKCGTLSDCGRDGTPTATKSPIPKVRVEPLVETSGGTGVLDSLLLGVLSSGGAAGCTAGSDGSTINLLQKVLVIVGH